MPTGIYQHKPISEETKHKISLANAGKKRTEECIQKSSEIRKGKRPKHLIGYKHTEETKKKTGERGKGRPKSKNAYSFPIGKNHPRWRGGITPLTKQIRHCFKHRQWISDVFERDNYTCQRCDKRGGNLEAHHLKPFALIFKENNIKTLEQALFCEELWNINNGMTLCKECHNLTKRYGNR